MVLIVNKIYRKDINYIFMSMSKNVFVLLSGGIDSAVCLQKAINKYENIEAIHFSYGQQTQNIEKNNTKKQTQKQNIPLHIIDYQDIFKNFEEGTIENKQYNKNQTTQKGGHSVGYVPQRNLHFLTTAAAIAEHNSEIEKEIIIFHGAQRNDREDYPDCRPKFMESVEKTINLSTDQNKIEIKNPLIDLSKKEIIELGVKLNIDWSLTFSCYNDDKGDPCRGCPACIERKKAFDKAGIEDPIYK